MKKNTLLIFCLAACFTVSMVLGIGNLKKERQENTVRVEKSKLLEKKEALLIEEAEFLMIEAFGLYCRKYGIKIDLEEVEKIKADRDLRIIMYSKIKEGIYPLKE